MDDIRKFDGHPLSLLPTTILEFPDGAMGCDPVDTEAPMLFPCVELADAHIRLATEAKKKGIRAEVVGTDAIILLVRQHPEILRISFVTDMGDLHSHTGKLQREYYTCHVKRDAFLSMVSSAKSKE